MRRFPTLDAGAIRIFFKTEFGSDVEATWLGGYLGRNAVWRIEPGGKVLKIFFGSSDSKRYFDRAREKANAEAFAYQALGRGHFPVPVYLGSIEVEGHPAVLYSYVPGALWQNYQVPEECVLPLYRQLGALLARMHSVALPIVPTAPDHMKSFDRERIFCRALALPPPHNALMRRAEARLREVTAVLGPPISHRPNVLTHGDFTPRNVLISDGPSPRITGIIDFERARIADPMLDFAMLAYKEFLHGGGIKAAVLSGYISERALPAAADLLLEAHLLELFLEIAGWAIDDDPEYFDRMIAALDRLLAQDPVFRLGAPSAQSLGPER